MNFTSVDPPQVIRFVRTQYPDVVTHAPEKSIFQLAVERGILPSMRIRWCCADLKETAGAGKVTLIGIRKQESTRRAKRHEVEVSNRQFSGSLDEFEVWQKEQIEKKEQKLIRKMQKEGKKVNEDEFSLRTDNEVRCINGKDSILISPIFEWTEQDVWYFLNEVVKVPHCELYDQGYKRIGCIICPMSSFRQKIREMKDFPHVKRNWIKAIKAIRNGRQNLSLIAERLRTGTPGGTYPNTGHRGTSAECQELGAQNYPPLQQKFGNRYTPTEWNKMFQRLAMEVRRRQEFTPITGTGKQTQGFGLDSVPRRKPLDGFSDSPSANGVVEGQSNEPTEDEIAEMIFDWWISGKSYSKWYADKFIQQKIDFED